MSTTTTRRWWKGVYTGHIFAGGKEGRDGGIRSAIVIARVTGEASGLITPAEAEANGNLIAAAPDLLLACRAILSAWKEPTSARERLCGNAITRIESAIRAAEGEL